MNYLKPLKMISRMTLDFAGVFNVTNKGVIAVFPKNKVFDVM